MITVTDLTKRYARHTAVDHISFEVHKGQIVGFLGPNGAGKTTTMRMLTCFLPPTSGAATVAGFDVLEQSFEVKKRIGYLPETPPLYPEMRTAEYLQFVGSLKGLSKSDLAKRVDYVCERCAIVDVKDKLLGKLSKGYRQRVGLAQAIIHNPDVLILDEPTSGLDPKQINDTRELIKSLAGDHTKSRLELVSGVSRVSLKNKHDNRSVFEVESRKGLVRGDLARAVVEAGWDLNELRPAAVSLEEIFLQLTGDAAAAPAEEAVPAGVK